MAGKQTKRYAGIGILIGLAALLSACQSLPPLSGRTVSTYLPVPSSPALTQAFHTPKLPQGKTAVYLLDDPQDAFAARQTMIERSQYSLDIQYYMWHNDVSGRRMFALVRQAAQRGVRVRLLLDDNNTYGTDDLLAQLNRMPNVEIRLFNPFVYRRFRTLGYLSDFFRLNRRMHNKLLIADNQLAVIGGRNIGDEYFNISRRAVFSDLDVLLTGNVVTQASRDFDRYWQSSASYPFERIATCADAERGKAEMARHAVRDGRILAQYREMLQAAPLGRSSRQNPIPWRTVAHAQLVSDPPDKAFVDNHTETLVDTLSEKLGMPQRSLFIVSPYFVPTRNGVEMLTELADDGIDVTVFTNSLQAIDVAAAYAGYAKYRKALLSGGVKLYEMKPDTMTLQNSAEEGSDSAETLGKSVKMTGEGSEKNKRILGSSVMSLHAKALVVDNQRLFVGSFNMDPRSAHLNTETGVVIDDAAFTGEVVEKLRNMAPQYAYQVTLDRQNRLRWHTPENPEEPLKWEPEAGFWKRAAVELMSVLPIEDLL